jgi:hypothetical protein
MLEAPELVTAGEPRYIFSFAAFAGCMNEFQAATAAAMVMQEPPAPGLGRGRVG